jgi:hypothetical protein
MLRGGIEVWLGGYEHAYRKARVTTKREAYYVVHNARTTSWVKPL